MIRFGRAAVVGVLAVLGLVATAGPAPAQFGGGFGYGSRPFLPGLSITPPGISYGQSFQLYATTPLGASVSLQREFYGPAGLWASRRYAPVYNSPGPYSPFYTPTYSGYMSGGVKNAAVDGAAKDFARAQLQAQAARAVQSGAKNAIYDQWAYEKLETAGLAGLRSGGDAPAPLVAAMAAADPAEVASGEALNHVMVAVVAAEPKAGKVESAYVSPLVLSKIRFGGSATADAVNLLRQVGRVEYPAAFETGALSDLRPALDRELTAAAGPVLTGKPADPARVAALEATAGKARKALDPAVLDMGFENAIAARKFLNQVDAAGKALRAAGAAGLIDPRWAAEGVGTADLVRHMSKYNLLFGPARKGDEDAYLALHRGLVGYLAGLTAAQKAGAKK